MSAKGDTPRTPPELWVVIENFDEGDGFSAFASQQLAMDHHQDLIDEVPECGPFLVCRYISAAALLAGAPDVEGLVKRVNAGLSLPTVSVAIADVGRLVDALLSLLARIKALEERLEIPTQGEFKHLDGIACRDETIRLQDEAFVRLQAELAAAKAEVARQISANGHWHTRIEQEKALRVQAEAERGALRDPNHPDNYEGSTLQRLDDLVHELTGDEGEDDSFTVLRRAWDALREDADSLARALISVRQQMFPGTDQRAVISRDFPRITSIAAIDRERQK